MSPLAFVCQLSEREKGTQKVCDYLWGFNCEIVVMVEWCTWVNVLQISECLKLSQRKKVYQWRKQIPFWNDGLLMGLPICASLWKLKKTCISFEFSHDWLWGVCCWNTFDLKVICWQLSMNQNVLSGCPGGILLNASLIPQSRRL